MTSILTTPIITQSAFQSISPNNPELSLMVGNNVPYINSYAVDDNGGAPAIAVKIFCGLAASGMESFSLEAGISTVSLGTEIMGPEDIPTLSINFSYEESGNIGSAYTLWFISARIENCGDVELVEVIINYNENDGTGPKRGAISVPKKGVES